MMMTHNTQSKKKKRGKSEKPQPGSEIPQYGWTLSFITIPNTAQQTTHPNTCKIKKIQQTKKTRYVHAEVRLTRSTAAEVVSEMLVSNVAWLATVGLLATAAATTVEATGCGGGLEAGAAVETDAAVGGRFTGVSLGMRATG